MSEKPDPSDARARIAAIQQKFDKGGRDGLQYSDIRRLLVRIAQLEAEACIKDAYAYELAKERDALDTQLGDALERLAELEPKA